MKDLLRVNSNERVDLTDFQFLSNESIANQTTELIHNFLGHPTNYKNSILSGFDMSNPSGSQVRVETGRAILSQRFNGVVVESVLSTSGDDYKIVDMSTYPDNTYNIYIRFEQIPGDTEGRIFWNSTGNGSEYTQTMQTRYNAYWSVRIETSSPGNEWFRIGSVVKPSMSITDSRDLYFEGPVDYSYQSNWSTEGGGSANDRDSDRATYGITDLHTFVSAIRQCIEDIRGRGLRRWYEKGIGGLNIGFDDDPAENCLYVGDANFGLTYSSLGSYQQVKFDDGSAFQYTRSTDNLVYKRNNSTYLTMDSTGTTLEKHVTVNASSAVGIEVLGSGPNTGVTITSEVGQNATALAVTGRGTGRGIYAIANDSGDGIYGFNNGTGHGVHGKGGDTGTTYGVYGENGNASGYAGYFTSDSASTATLGIENTSTGSAVSISGSSNATSVLNIAQSGNASGFRVGTTGSGSGVNIDTSSGTGASLRLTPLSSAPAGGSLSEGDIWFDATTHTLKYYDGTTTKTVTAS